MNTYRIGAAAVILAILWVILLILTGQGDAPDPLPPLARQAQLQPPHQMTPHPATSATVSQAPRGRGSLWQSLEQASRSGQPAAIYAGLNDALECMGVQREQSELQNFVAMGSGLMATRGDMEARRAAAQRLLMACMEFITRGVPEGQRIVQQLRTAGASTGMAVFQKPEDPEALREMADVLLESGQPSQQAVGLQVLERYVLPRLPDEEAPLFLAAARTVACDLGRDCSAQGLDMSLLCAQGGVCGIDATAFFTADIPEDQRERLAHHQRRIALLLQKRLAIADLLP